MRTFAAPLLALAATLALTSCGGNDEQASCSRPAGAGTQARSGSGAADVTFLTSIDVHATKCGDRIVFAFRGDAERAPGFRISYEPAATALVEDGSGARIDAAGSAYLVLRLSPTATAEADGDGSLTFTYTGPRRLRPDDASFVRELVKSGDFEAVVSWVIGMDERRPFTVSTSASPPRLILEVA
jgi:hypothetical protein